MPYSAQISRVNPACILLLVDQSRSMAEPFGNNPDTTKDAVLADAVNRLLQNLVLRSAKADGVRDYFHVGVIGYGHTIVSALGGQVPYEVLRPISRIAAKPLRVEERKKTVVGADGASRETRAKHPVWYEPQANGATPMAEAMSAAVLAVMAFTQAYPNAYPPIVLNLTDGRPSDANPQSASRTLRGLSTSDGNVLLFNLLLASTASLPIHFLADEGLLTDTYSKLLFRMSSVLPPKMADAARHEGFPVDPDARGVVFNADPVAVVKFLDIGTRVGTPLK